VPLVVLRNQVELAAHPEDLPGGRTSLAFGVSERLTAWQGGRPDGEIEETAEGGTKRRKGERESSDRERGRGRV